MKSSMNKLAMLLSGLILASAWLLLVPATLFASGTTVSPASQSAMTTDASPIISGTYQGTVAITVPVQLGILDMAFSIADIEGVLTGAVSADDTLVYATAPALYGTFDGITFTITSEVFEEVVSGRVVQRSFTLVGTAQEDGDILQGLYTETMTGFTPKPMVMEGIFMVTRPPRPTDFSALSTIAVQPAASALWPNDSTPVTIRLSNGYREPFTTTTPVTLTSSLGDMTPALLDVANGEATVTFTAGDAPGTATLIATTGAFTGSAVIEIQAYSAAALTLTTPVTLLPTGDGVAIVTATVRDQIDQPVAGAMVDFAGTLGAVTPLSATTDASGVVTATFTAGAMPGMASVTAMCTGLNAEVSFQLQTPEVSELAVQAGSLVMPPQAQTAITVTVYDQFARPVAGEVVSLFASLGGVSPSSGVSNAAGQVIASFTAGNLPGQATITALTGYASDSVTVQIETSPLVEQSGVAFTPDHTAQAQPGEVLTFTHTLTNTGEVTDTFALMLTGDWATLLTATPLTLTGGATATVQVEVTVSTAAISGTVSSAAITATSQLDPAVYAVVVDAVTVYTVPVTPPHAGVIFTPDHNVQAQPGEVLTFTHTLTNTGEVTDTFALMLTGDWATLLTAMPLTLTAGATATVQVEVAVPSAALSGTVGTTVIMATSQLDPAVFVVVHNIITVYTEYPSPKSYIFLPLVLRQH